MYVHACTHVCLCERVIEGFVCVCIHACLCESD